LIDHTGIIVSDFVTSRAWYQAAFAPIGYRLLIEAPRSLAGYAGVAGFGEVAIGKPDFWIFGATATQLSTKPPLHIAFRAATRALVDAFHKAAIEAGGRDNGAPGLRPHYHPHYYGAFVLDPDGHNIEAVCHASA
jgi:catechol 2,3-dioxygenase-like lactoylglutathione lyase family enzyme